jgi:hypothetical protein
MGKKELKALRDLVAEARKHATFENSHFSDICAYQKQPVEYVGAPLTERQVTEFIKDRTRIYRETWIVGFLDDALRMIDGQEAIR